MSWRDLYRQIRRIHRQLPPDLKYLGNQYVRDEFRRHSTATREYIPIFLKEWQSYLEMVREQIKMNQLGKKLEQLDSLSPQQLGQLYELRKVTKGKD